jgi:hypothetical protein
VQAAARGQLPESAQIPAVVAMPVNRRFQNKGAPGQQRMGYDSRESFRFNVSLADVLMAVRARAKRHPGIVDVNHMDAAEADGSLDGLESLLKALGRANLESRSQQVGRIEANTEGKTGGDGARHLHHRGQFLKTGTEHASLPRGIFQQNAQTAQVQPASGLAKAIGDRGQGRLQRRSNAAAGMKDEVFRV